jgi:hypothetical protein
MRARGGRQPRVAYEGGAGIVNRCRSFGIFEIQISPNGKRSRSHLVVGELVGFRSAAWSPEVVFAGSTSSVIFASRALSELISANTRAVVTCVGCANVTVLLSWVVG